MLSELETGIFVTQDCLKSPLTADPNTMPSSNHLVAIPSKLFQTSSKTWESRRIACPILFHYPLPLPLADLTNKHYWIVYNNRVQKQPWISNWKSPELCAKILWKQHVWWIVFFIITFKTWLHSNFIQSCSRHTWQIERLRAVSQH